MKRPYRPHDPMQRAKMIGEIATGELPNNSLKEPRERRDEGEATRWGEGRDCAVGKRDLQVLDTGRAPPDTARHKRPFGPFLTTMKKGEATRRRIVAQAASLLNTKGYRSTPVSEIMRVTGLRKGGIYRHFDSRTTLTL